MIYSLFSFSQKYRFYNNIHPFIKSYQKVTHTKPFISKNFYLCVNELYNKGPFGNQFVNRIRHVPFCEWWNSNSNRNPSFDKTWRVIRLRAKQAFVQLSLTLFHSIVVILKANLCQNNAVLQTSKLMKVFQSPTFSHCKNWGICVLFHWSSGLHFVV